MLVYSRQETSKINYLGVDLCKIWLLLGVSTIHVV